jgi:tRNA (guanosine-2'-O-)-methyltransferase
LQSGFVESFNISVAGALVMYEAQQQRIRKLGKHGDLTHDQQLALQASLMMRSLVSQGSPVYTIRGAG